MKTRFTTLENASIEDWKIIDSPNNVLEEQHYIANNLIELLRRQEHSSSFGWPVNAYTHCLQSATRAFRAGESDDFIFAALFHDATEALDGHNHSQTAAYMIKPYVNEDIFWMVKNHAIFQDYHCNNHPKRFSDARKMYKAHKAYDLTLRFCRDYDQNSFDASYDNMTLEDFIPLIKRKVLSIP